MKDGQNAELIRTGLGLILGLTWLGIVGYSQVSGNTELMDSSEFFLSMISLYLLGDANAAFDRFKEKRDKE